MYTHKCLSADIHLRAWTQLSQPGWRCSPEFATHSGNVWAANSRASFTSLRVVLFQPPTPGDLRIFLPILQVVSLCCGLCCATSSTYISDPFWQAWSSSLSLISLLANWTPASAAPSHPSWLYLCVVGSAGGWHVVWCDSETIIYSQQLSACSKLSFSRDFFC